MKEIVVTYQSEILGSGIFWKGKPELINEIRNIPARELAKKVVKDGIERKDGMWNVDSKSK